MHLYCLALNIILNYWPQTSSWKIEITGLCVTSSSPEIRRNKWKSKLSGWCMPSGRHFYSLQSSNFLDLIQTLVHLFSVQTFWNSCLRPDLKMTVVQRVWLLSGGVVVAENEFHSFCQIYVVTENLFANKRRQESEKCKALTNVKIKIEINWTVLTDW